MSFATILDAGAFVIGNLAALLIAAAIGVRAVPKRDDAALRFAVGSAAFILIVSLLTLLLGTLGLLDAHLAAGVLVIPAIAATLMLKRNADPDCNRGTSLFDPRPLREWSPLLPIAIGLGAWWLVRNLALGTWITNDDNTYHAAILIEWLRDGEIGIVPSTYQAYFPLNGELLALWFLLPFGHDGAVPLAGMTYLTLFLSLSLHFAERLGTSPRWRLLPAILVLASTPTLFGLTTFTDMDFSPPVMMLAAIAFLLAALEKADRHKLRHPEIHWPLVLLGGTCAGFVVGMKVSFAPPAAVICAIFAFTALRRSGLKLTLAASALVAVAAIGAGAYWYLRNWVITGNPVYPAALGPFEGPFGSAEQSATKLSTVVAEGLDSEQWRQLLGGFFNRPWMLALVILSGTVAALVALARRHVLSADQRLLVFSLLACSAVVTLLFPVTPFSGTNEVGGLEVTGRYLNFFYLAGGTLAVLLLIRAPELQTIRARFLVLLIGIAVFTLPFALHTAKPVIVAILGVTVLGFFALELLSRLPGLRLPKLRFALLLVPLLALATVPLNLRSTDKAARLNPIVAEIENLPTGSKVAHYNRFLYRGYFLAGRRLQHEAVRLNGDGTRYIAMHSRSENDRGGTEDFWTYERRHGERSLTAAALVKNLGEAEIDFLITSPHPNGGWPEQHQLLEDAGTFPKFSTSEHATVWDLRNQSAGPSDASAAISDLHTGTVPPSADNTR
jgi:hypothetical protein